MQGPPLRDCVTTAVSPHRLNSRRRRRFNRQRPPALLDTSRQPSDEIDNSWGAWLNCSIVAGSTDRKSARAVAPLKYIPCNLLGHDCPPLACPRTCSESLPRSLSATLSTAKGLLK